MFSINRTTITGTVPKPAQTSREGATSVTRARLVHDETLQRPGGDPLELVAAVEIEISGRSGDHFAAFVTPDTPIYIEGSLGLREHDGGGGSCAIHLCLRVSAWQFLLPTNAKNRRYPAPRP